jgi:hypothetical protein
MKINFKALKKNKKIQVSSLTAIFCLLLIVGLSFYSGIMYLKNKNANLNSISGTTLELVKSNKPTLEFYMMSFCPYGNQMESILRPVFDLIGDKVNLQPRYIFDEFTDLENTCKNLTGDIEMCPQYVEMKYVSSIKECEQIINKNYQDCVDENNYIKSSDGKFYSALHGRQEATQNLREICAWNVTEDKSKWWNFIENINVNCNYENADSCWEDQAKAANLDIQAINNCFNNDGIKLIQEEIALTTKNNIQGSPTLMLNDVLFPSQEAYKEDGSGAILLGKKIIKQADYRTPNGIKEAICYAFKKAPKECSTIIEQDPNVQGAATNGGCQ